MVDFPEPLTPVTQTRQFKGIVILTSFRLFPEALLILKVLPAFKDIFLVIGFLFFLAKYLAVIDFLDFHIKSYHWPAFNVADSCIFIGATLIILDSLFPDKKEETSIKSI